MKLGIIAGGALRAYASEQSTWHRGVVTETCKLLKVQSVTQPNSKSTVQMHEFAAREAQTAQRWAQVAQ